MAKQRFVNTRFWSDNFIVGLKPIERYLFLYFLTNEHTNICGIYELPMRTMVFETEMTEKEINKALKSMEDKIFYVDGWVYVKNFERHQVARGSAQVKTGVDKAKKEVPSEIMSKIEKLSNSKPKLDRVHPPSDGISTLDLDLDTDRDLDLDTDLISVPTVAVTEKSINWIRNLPETEISELCQKYRVDSSTIRACTEDLIDYCESKGRKYANYKAALRNFIKNHIERHPECVRKQTIPTETQQVIEKKENRTPEEQAAMNAKMQEMREAREKFKNKISMNP